MKEHDSILELQTANKLLKEQVKLLEEKISYLLSYIQKIEVKKDSHNSSKPPSSDFVKPNQSLRTQSERKSGGQKGHAGSTLKISDTPDATTVLQSSFCKKCGFNLSESLFYQTSKRQIIDIPPIIPKYVEYQQMACECANCGTKNIADYPIGVNAPIQYGTSVEAFVGYFSVYQSIPYFRLKELFTQLFSIPISEGTIENILNRVSDKCLSIYERIKNEILKSTVVGSDETGCNVNGKQNWIWVWQNKLNTYIVPSDSRGFDTIMSVFAEGLGNATLISDRWAAQLKMKTKNKQICLAHLQRELTYLDETEKTPFASQFKELIEIVFKLKREQVENGKACNEGDEIAIELEKKLQNLLAIPIDKEKATKTLLFQNSMLKNQKWILTCIYNIDVPPDNNASERAIRIIKVKHKVSGQFKTGQEAYCIIRSIIDTLKKRGLDIMTYFKLILDLKLLPE